MKYIFILFILLISCSQKEKQKQKPPFKKIKYDLSYNYKDSLVQKIIPGKVYDYWVYITIKDMNYNIILEKGDFLQKHKYETKLKDPSLGFFAGCHPHWCADYILTIKNNSLHFITTESEAISFLGTIDNFEEALLLAKLNGYTLDDDIRASAYRIVDDGFEMHLCKFSKSPLQKEFMEIIINKNGSMMAKSLGVYAIGIEAYN